MPSGDEEAPQPNTPPEGAAPPPAARDDTVRNRGAFIIGLVIGAIPLAIGYVAVGFVLSYDPVTYPLGFYNALGPLMMAGVAYLAAWWIALVLLAASGARRVALGMIAALLASPVIYYVSCQVLYRTPRS
jgi:hypothetical protein